MRTDLGALAALPEADVAGILLHMSRCGSTLACRMLATDSSLAVVAEPAPLDQLLTGPGTLAERAAWVRGLLGAFGATGRRVVVKADAWSVFDVDVLKAAVPGLRWAFLTRDPAEVIASHLREPGSHMVTGAPRAASMAAVLDRITVAARDALDVGAIVVDYADMPAAVIDRICPHFGVAPDREHMLAASVADSKRPYETFDRRTERAARPITPEVRAAAATVTAVSS
jgi:hypothetical protein